MGQVPDIMDTAKRSGVFETFIGLVEGSPLEWKLRDADTYTLFAPTDIAFAHIPPRALNHLLQAENQGMLAIVLSYHVVLGKVMSSDLRNLPRLKTAYGEDLIIKRGDELRIGGARLLQTDIEARNGVIHATDRLLLPSSRTVDFAWV